MKDLKNITNKIKIKLLDGELKDYHQHLIQKNIFNDIRKIGWKNINEA